ncbi:MAG: VWA domain-containing protein [Planctomycetota bacterium]|nr:VWA domain-containing protein [Planctomycetota bacterium]
MTFLYPERLLLLCIPAILCWWLVRRKGTQIKLPMDGMETRPRKGLKWFLRTFELFPSVMLATALVMIALPQVLKVPDRERVATHITICMDVSGSMGAGMGEMNRYESAASAIESFTLAREGDAIGLTLFGSWPLRWVPLTKDLQALRNALVFANPRNQPRGMGGTMIGAALEYCADNMEREGARLDGSAESELNATQWRSNRAKTQLFGNAVSLGGRPGLNEGPQNDRLLVLVSDGASGDLNGTDSVGGIVDRLNEAGITMYHIHIGSDTIPNAVSTIAEETGGRAFLATNSDGLKLIFDHIDRMQPAKFVATASVPTDFFEPFAAVALFTLVIWLISLLKWRQTPW